MKFHEQAQRLFFAALGAETVTGHVAEVQLAQMRLERRLDELIETAEAGIDIWWPGVSPPLKRMAFAAWLDSYRMERTYSIDEVLELGAGPTQDVSQTAGDRRP